MLQINANLMDLFLLPRQRGISKTSGGIGKNDASENEIKANDLLPLGFLDKFITQSYIDLTKFISF